MEEKKNNSIEYDEDGIPKLEYIQVGEFLLPNLALEEVDGYIGRWGMMRKRYLQERKPAVYSSMLLMFWKNSFWRKILHQIRQRMGWLGQDT